MFHSLSFSSTEQPITDLGTKITRLPGQRLAPLKVSSWRSDENWFTCQRLKSRLQSPDVTFSSRTTQEGWYYSCTVTTKLQLTILTVYKLALIIEEI